MEKDRESLSVKGQLGISVEKIFRGPGLCIHLG